MLTEMQVKNAKPAQKTYKLTDAAGLQLWVYPDGARRWRLAYRFDGTPKTLGLGVYPSVGIKDARIARDTAKRQIAAGVDPVQAKRDAKIARKIEAASTFSAVADEFLAKKKREGRSEKTLKKLTWILGIVRPALGQRPIAQIKAAEVLVILKDIDAEGKHETANRLRAVVGEVFRFAVANTYCEADPTVALRGALTTPTITHRASIKEPLAFGGLLRAIAGYDGDAPTRAALELLSLTFVRPGELRAMEWSEINLDKALWTIPAVKMKMRRPHLVPLAPRAVAILRDMHTITGKGRYVFPSARGKDRCMSDGTINAALRRMGYDKETASAHGFRSSASTILNESKLFHPDAIERQLAHVEANAVRRAYDHAEHWDERVRMMTWWADKCAAMRDGAEVVAFKKRGA